MANILRSSPPSFFLGLKKMGHETPPHAILLLIPVKTIKFELYQPTEGIGNVLAPVESYTLRGEFP